MTPDRSKQLMNTFLKFINTADKNLAKEIVSQDAIFHIPGQQEPMQGPDGYLAIIGMMRSGFSDIQWTLEDSVAENDKVAARFIMHGTHNGAFMGVPPTGKKIKVQAMNFYRFSDGKIIEEFGQPDMLGLLMQIGAVPAP